jgi:hypothetical protein
MRLAGGLLLLIPVAASAQWPGDQKIPPVRYPDFPRHSATLAGFVPREWKLEQKAVGDLNGDRRPDAALVLHMTSAKNRIAPSFAPDTRYDTNPRMLVLLLARKSGGYDLVAADHKLIPRYENPNMDDPFDGIAIKSGVLTVRMHARYEGGGYRDGTAAFRLRLQDGAARLIGYDGDWQVRPTGETEVVSVNYPARRLVVTKGSMSGDPPDKTETLTLPKKPLLTLDQVDDGLMFDPDER